MAVSHILLELVNFISNGELSAERGDEGVDDFERRKTVDVAVLVSGDQKISLKARKVNLLRDETIGCRAFWSVSLVGSIIGISIPVASVVTVRSYLVVCRKERHTVNSLQTDLPFIRLQTVSRLVAKKANEAVVEDLRVGHSSTVRTNRIDYTATLRDGLVEEVAR